MNTDLSNAASNSTSKPVTSPATHPASTPVIDPGNRQQSTPESSQKATPKRGFAAMDASQQRAIASRGGQAAHQKGTAHEFNSEEARRAGQKGGEAVSRDRAHMSAIGRKGGESRQSASRLRRKPDGA